MDKHSSARRAFAIFYMVIPFIVFYKFVVFYWQHPNPILTNPASPNFNEFEGPINWTIAYSLWEMLPTLPLLVWPVPIALWLYRHPPTRCKSIGVAVSFLVFLLIAFYIYAGLVMTTMARH